MVKSIFKYELPRTNSDVYMYLPKGTKILCVGNQYEKLVMWAIVDLKEKESENRHFIVTYTGEENCPDDANYIGTVSFEGGGYIQHVFEKVNNAS